MRVIKTIFAVILLLVGLLCAVVDLGVLVRHDSTEDWVGFIISSTVGIVTITLGVRTLYRLRAPSPGASIPTGNPTVAKAASVTRTSKRSSPTLLGTLVKGAAVLAAVGIAKDQADRAKRSRPKNYQCDKCGTAIQSGQQPAYVKCRSGGYHNWQNLGLVGSINYECGKCGVTVKSAEAPAFVRCPTGAYHDWNRL